MEDQIVKWRMVEYTSLEEEEDEEDEGEVEESKMRWIVNKGLCLGKKVMITGIVISSAPVVLPPLIVISALGFAFSVPFGLAFASYTCTEKLMNKLLPRSEPSLFLEYGGDEKEYDEQVGVKGPGFGFGGEMLMEEEEKKEIEDVKEGVELRIQLVMEESGGYDVGGPVLVEDKDFRRAENWEFDEKIKGIEGLDLVPTEASGENEGEKDVTLTPGLIERNLVEVYVGDALKEDNHTVENSGGKVTHPEVVEKPLESKDDKVHSLVREIQGTNVSKSSKKHHKKKKANDGKREGLSNKQQEETDVKRIEKKEEVKQEEEHLPVKRESKDEANQSGVSKKPKKATEMDKTLPGSRDARNVKDVGQAVNSTTDPKVVSNDKHVSKDGSPSSEDKNNLVAAKEVQKKAPDVHGNLLSERKETTDQKKNANASGLDQVKNSKELFSEEKIWEKVNAMRKIVGYTAAAPQPLLVDELKALYIFTGVEPPSTFRNPSNLAEVNDKLQFLMSIVGIK